MMLHRHFEEQQKQQNMTRLKDVTPKAEFVSDVFPPDKDVAQEASKPKRGRAKKSEE